MVNSTHLSPKIISNQRDFYYLKSPIDYEEVWFDDVIMNANINEIKIKLEEYVKSGYSHLIYHAFSDETRHDKLIKSGSVKYLDKLKHFKNRNVIIYELK